MPDRWGQWKRRTELKREVQINMTRRLREWKENDDELFLHGDVGRRSIYLTKLYVRLKRTKFSSSVDSMLVDDTHSDENPRGPTDD